MPNTDRERILEFLRAHKDELRKQFGVTRLGLVGSYARDEAREESDIDLVVSLQSENSFRSFFGLFIFWNKTKRVRSQHLTIWSATVPLELMTSRC